MASEFLDPLRLEQTGWKDGRPVWMTLTPLRYRSDLLGITLVVPAKMISDLASVPRLPILWLATGGRGPRSAVLHDMPYQFGFWLRDVEESGGGRRYVRKDEADAVFYESLEADPMSGANRVRAWEMLAGVRINMNGGVWGDRARTRALNPIWSASGRPEDEAP